MSSVQNICNLALAHIGNPRRVVAIDPPDGTVEADLCSTFYPQAVTETLEMADWAFARKRVALSLLTNVSEIWTYTYARPSDCLVPQRIPTGDSTMAGQDTEPYDVEGDTIFTNKANAVLLYTWPMEDSTKFSGTFTIALSYLLASHLAGPIIKGDEGAKAAANYRKAAMDLARAAITLDANQTQAIPQHVPGALAARGDGGVIGAGSSDADRYGSGYGIY